MSIKLIAWKEPTTGHYILLNEDEISLIDLMLLKFVCPT